MKKIFALLALAAISCTSTPETRVEHPSDYVTTLVGTLSDYSMSTGNTYPAVARPWGMNFFTPHSAKMGDGWAYTYASHSLCGFKQTHQPSPWINDYAQFSLMPVRSSETELDEKSRSSLFSHQSETAKPHMYKVYLADHDTWVEFTATDRCGVFRFTYPESENAGLVIDAFERDSDLSMKDEYTIEGYCSYNNGGVTENFRNHFVLKSDKPFKVKKDVTEQKNRHMMMLEYPCARNEQVTVKVASSFISLEQAYINLEREVGESTYEEVLSESQQVWDETLGRIAVEGGSQAQLETFYSCLYRATLFPRMFYEFDRNGEAVHYSPYNGNIEKGYLYADTGFWDTFRALYPLLDLVYPSVSARMQEGLANAYRESGFLPEWSSPGHRGCMVGNNSASVVADAILKGITPEKDIETLYEALIHARSAVHPEVSSTGRLGHEYYNALGYVPYNVGIKENIARTLEYAYDDWCIAKVAQKLGKDEDAKHIFEACQNYRNVFDPKTRLMRGKNLDGTFQEPFSPYKWGDAYTEGNAWHYTWSVFHDQKGLQDLMGGREAYANMLDSVFIVPPIYDDSYYGFRIHEIAEMQVAAQGNYAHGNQPAQHVIYLYDYALEPWKAQFWTREVMDRLYSSKPDGYCGDEDNGQTSAWYVFSALGFYPTCPAGDEYAIGSPLFEKATVYLENGKRINITAEGNAPQNRYISKAKLNSKNWENNFLKYEDLLGGAQIHFSMSHEPNLTRGTKPDNMPWSMTE